MAAGQLGSILRRLLLAGERKARDGSDRQLLERFAAGKDDAAFAALLERHGRLVLGVCHSVLCQEQDAEDAFQATFLVLARMAGSIRQVDSLSSWLHGVALRTALKARRALATRRRHEEQAQTRSSEQPVSEAALRELQAILHEELARLADKYRAPFVLCCLEGKSRAEAAEQLGCPEGTVSGRIAQARAMLERRLAGRGVALSAALGAVALSPAVSSSAVPATLAMTAIRAAIAFASHSRPEGVSSQAVSLAEGVLKAMFLSKVRFTMGVVLAIALFLGGAGLLAYSAMQSTDDEGNSGPFQVAAHEEWPRPPLPPKEDKKPAPAVNKPAPEPEAQIDDTPLPPPAVARLGNSRWFFPGTVSHVAYSKDGKRIIVVAGGIRVLDARTGKELQTWPFSAVPDSIFLADNGKLAVAAGVGFAIWDTMSGKRTGTFKGHANLTTYVCGSADGRMLATLGDDAVAKEPRDRIIGFGPLPVPSARVWNADTGKELPPFAAGLKNAVSVAVAPDGKTLAWGTVDGVLRVVNIADGKERFRLDVPIHKVRGSYSQVPVTFSPDSKRLAYGTSDGVILVNAQDGKEAMKYPRRQPSSQFEQQFLGVKFSPQGNIVVAGWSNYGLSLWEVESGKDVSRVRVPFHAALSPDGTTIAVPRDHRLEFVDFETGEAIVDASLVTAGRFALSADAKVVATVETKRVRFWDRATGRSLRAVDLETTPDRFAISPDGSSLITICRNRPIVFDAQTGKKIKEFEPAEISSSAIAFSANGKAVAAVGTNGFGKIAHWDLVTGKLSYLLGANKAWIFSVAFSPDGKHLLAGTGDIIEPVDVKTGVSKSREDGAVYLWDLATHQQVRRIETASRYIYHLAVSPDGRLVGGEFGWIALDDPTKRREIEGIKVLAFSPDGKTVATAYNLVNPADSRTPVHLIDAETGKFLGALHGHLHRVHTLAFAADGRLLLSGAGDGTILVWDLSRSKK